MKYPVTLIPPSSISAFPMGGQISIINDTLDVIQVEVWTLGEGFMVDTQSIQPGRSHLFKLASVPYIVF